jgi:hypothetical protein
MNLEQSYCRDIRKMERITVVLSPPPPPPPPRVWVRVQAIQLSPTCAQGHAGELGVGIPFLGEGTGKELHGVRGGERRDGV